MQINSSRDAEQRLRNMYGLYKDNLVYGYSFSQVTPDKVSMEGRCPLTGNSFVDDISNFNFTKLNFGYTEFKGANDMEGVYVSQNPRRNTKQGVSSDTIYIDNLNSLYVRGAGTGSLIKSLPFRDMLMGKFEFDLEKTIYKSELEAEEFPYRTPVVRPITRHFALRASLEAEGEICLIYRGNQFVGKYNEGKFSLSNKYSFLKEHLERSNLKVA